MNRYTKIHDFAASRLLGVGSSDIATLAGLNRHYEPRPYKNTQTGATEKLKQTSLTLYREKRGEIERIGGSGRMEWGHRLEGLILAKWIEERWGAKSAADFLSAKLRGKSLGIFKSDTECRMPERAYVLAHADLLIEGGVSPVTCPECGDSDLYWPGENQLCTNCRKPIASPPEAIIVEAKSSGCYAAKRVKGEEFRGYDLDDRSHQGIPDSVYLQIQWQLLTYGVTVAYLSVLIDTGDYREYGPIPAAPRVQERCLALAERFWTCVEEGTPPKPETWSDVVSLWPEPNNLTAMVSGEDEMRAREYAARHGKLGERIRELQKEQEEVKAALGIYMGQNSILATAEGEKLASSTYTERASVKPFAEMTKLEKALLAGSPEIMKLYETLDKERAKVSARTKAIVEAVEKDEKLWNALAEKELISKGFRAIRIAKIKEG